MKLYGSTTSPYVRRVRIVATELGVPFELILSSTDEGQKALRALSPIWKVPVAEVDGQTIFDSHVIIEYLHRRHGYGPLRTAGGAAWVREHNLVNAADATLDSLISLLYLERDGIETGKTPILVKQSDRVKSILTWFEGQLRDTWLTDEARLGMAEIALVTALDWIVFRKRYPVEDHPGLVAFRAAHADRPSIRDTFPAE
jgi:glutathione S-transferase